MSLSSTELAVDIGGTFTDVVLRTAGGDVVSAKVLTTPDDPTDGLVVGVMQVLERARVDAGSVDSVVHATTLATNVILERRGAPVAFVTTSGFRSLLQLGRQARVEEERYDLHFQPAPPPVPESHVFTVPERIDASGAVLQQIDVGYVRFVVNQIAKLGVAGVAICLLHSYVNPEHERIVAHFCREELPRGTFVVMSSEVCPEIREYERATTTVMSAYVAPVMTTYLTRLQERLRGLGITAPVHIMDSSGGAMSVDLAARRAVYTVESGPAAGVLAAQQLGTDVISFDMGGTTAKAGVVRGGRADVTHQFHVGGKGSFGGRRAGTGVPIKAPAIDLAEVGSGGGSIAWVDAGGSLRVGPRSAGAEPGPACYGRGGALPTVTDADLILGYLAPESFAGGSMALDRAAAEATFARHVAGPLGATVTDASVAVHEIVNAAMGAAIHVVTVQRGIDPRDFVLVALGGAGPMHAAAIAERFEIDTVLVPAKAGVGSAVGLLGAELATERARTMLTSDAAALDKALRELAGAAAADLALDLGAPAVAVASSVGIRYRGQSFEMAVPIDTPVDEAAVTAAVERFYAAYRDAFTIDLRDPVEVVSARARVSLPRTLKTSLGLSKATLQTSERLVWFGGFVDTAVVRREALTAGEGPLIIEDDECTVVVPPGWSASIDERATVTMRRA